jgi:5'(3')-deoxyribonucleotidase
MAKNKPIIAIDVDDVLARTNEGLMHFINRHYGTNHTWEEYDVEGEYDGYWEMVWNVPKDEARKRYSHFVESGVSKELIPVDGAIDALKQLKKRFELVIITARSDEQMEDTHHWLDSHFPELFKSVDFVPTWDPNNKVSKGIICKQIGASYLVDDSIDHCRLALEEGIEAILFGHYGWNKSQELPKGLSRIKTWPKVVEYFDGKGR